MCTQKSGPTAEIHDTVIKYISKAKLIQKLSKYLFRKRFNFETARRQYRTAAVQCVESRNNNDGNGKRRGKYSHYDCEQRARIAHYANEYGLSATSQQFKVPVSTQIRLDPVSLHSSFPGLSILRAERLVSDRPPICIRRESISDLYCSNKWLPGANNLCKM